MPRKGRKGRKVKKNYARQERGRAPISCPIAKKSPAPAAAVVSDNEDDIEDANAAVVEELDTGAAAEDGVVRSSARSRPGVEGDIANAYEPVDSIRVRYVDRPDGAGRRQPVLLAPSGTNERRALSPLLACANALCVCDELNFPNFGSDSIRVEALKEVLLDKLQEMHETKKSFGANPDGTLKLFEEILKLSCPPPGGELGWKVNPCFTAGPEVVGYDGILFDAFGLTVVHGHLTNHRNERFMGPQGARYDDLIAYSRNLRNQAKYDILPKLTEEVKRADDELTIALSTEADESAIAAAERAYHAARKKREEAVDRTHNRASEMMQFLKTAKEVITPEGMRELDECTLPGEVHILYHDESFSVLKKGPDGKLYTLIADDRSSDKYAVWKRLGPRPLDPSDIKRRQPLVDANFVSTSSSQSASLPREIFPPLPALEDARNATASADTATAAGSNHAKEEESGWEECFHRERAKRAEMKFDSATALAASLHDTAPSSLPMSPPPPQARKGVGRAKDVDPNKIWNVELAVALDIRALHHRNIDTKSDDACPELQPWEDWNNGADVVRSVGELMSIRSENAFQLLSDREPPRVMQTCLSVIRGDEDAIPDDMRAEAEDIASEERLYRKEEHDCLVQLLSGEEAKASSAEDASDDDDASIYSRDSDFVEAELRKAGLGDDAMVKANEAATFIQGTFRGLSERRRFVRAKEERAQNGAASKINASARGLLARRDLRRKVVMVTRMNTAARGFLERRRLRRKTASATVINAASRGQLARKWHRAVIVAGVEEWRTLREQWEEALALVRRAKEAKEVSASDGKGELLDDLVFSWSKLKRDKFDISQANENLVGEDEREELDSTSRRIDDAYRSAPSEDEGDGIVDDRNEAVANGEGSTERSAPAHALAHDAVSGGGAGRAENIEAFENILLTHSTLKWFKGADGTYQDMFRRRMRQLAGGERSRILAKLLTGCKHTIYETYLDQASAQRIIWTECREKKGGQGDKNGTSILVWYVSKHKWVSRYLEQIDDALVRMNRQQFTGSAAHLFEDELEKGQMVLDSDMILLDPLANVPLKIHQLPALDIDKLDREAWTPPLRLTAAEREVVRKPGTVLVLGRSGTGKTVCICNRMVCDAEFHRGGHAVRLRQLFVARSAKIKNLVQSLVEEESPADQLSDVERKFVSFARLMKDCSAAIDRMGERSALKGKGAPQRPVDFCRFKANFFQALGKEKRIKLDALVIWTQIRSYIKGSIEAVKKGGPLSLEEYLRLGKNRCSLGEGKRKEAYSVFESYTRWLSEHNCYDACDRTTDVLCRLRRTSLEDRLKEGVNFSRIYVDETQDFTQSDIALFWVLCEGGGSLFLAGDTAQSVEEGINFRFDEVRSVCYELSCGDNSRVPNKPLNVTLNFRSHSGVLDVAAAVLHMLYQAFPGAANKLPDDVGLFKGPRPSVLCRRDSKFLEDSTLDEVLKKNPSLVILTPDDQVDSLKGEISCSAESIILGACEAKGLDFDQVAIVNFFSSSTKQQARAWKELFKNASGKQSAWEMSKYPELEMRMKLLYTAITRCRHRLFFAETSNSPCGDAFIRWILGGDSKLAEKQDIADLTVELKSPDEWLSLGIEYALNAEVQEEAEGAKDWFERASVCFQHGGDDDLKRRAASHADLRSILQENSHVTDWLVRKQSVPKILASCFKLGGFVEDAIQLCETALEQCPQGDSKFETIVDEVLSDLKSLGS